MTVRSAALIKRVTNFLAARNVNDTKTLPTDLRAQSDAMK